MEGIGFVWANRKMVALLAILPLLVTLVTQWIVLAKFVGEPFWAAIVQLPSEFMIGAYSVFIVLAVKHHHEAMLAAPHGQPPLPSLSWRRLAVVLSNARGVGRMQEADNAGDTGDAGDVSGHIAAKTPGVFNRGGDTHILAAILAFATVSFLFSGIFGGLTLVIKSYDLAAFQDVVSYAPESMSDNRAIGDAVIGDTGVDAVGDASGTTSPVPPLPTSFVLIILGSMVFIFWMMRFFWLHVFIAMQLPLMRSFRKMGGMEGSVMVGIMFLVSIVMTMLALSIVLSIALPLFGVSDAGELSNVARWVKDGLSIFGLIIAHGVFSAASARAVLYMYSPALLNSAKRDEE